MKFLKSQKVNSDNDEFLKYIPIASVACFEGATRSLLKELIDKGHPYAENCENLVSKFDFSIFKEIQKKRFTLGEFVSHFLSCNRLEDINANFSKILNVDFLNELSNFTRISIEDEKNADFKYFNENYTKIYADVQRIFELRHIFCHETASQTTITYLEAEEFLITSIRFIVQVEEYVNSILGINYEKMLPEQIEELENELERIRDIVQEKIAQIRQRENYNHPELSKASFEAFISSWNSYSDARSEWKRSFPYTGNYQYYAALESLVESNNELNEILDSVR